MCGSLVSKPSSTACFTRSSQDWNRSLARPASRARFSGECSQPSSSSSAIGELVRLVWSGLVWSGLVWSGLGSVTMGLAETQTRTRIVPQTLGLGSA